MAHRIYDNGSPHKCEVVMSFLASEKEEIKRPPYSHDLLSHRDFF